MTTYHPRYVMLRLAGTRTDDPVVMADRRTSMDDARAALCLTLGVGVDDIDPSSGHNLSYESYVRVRDSWINYAAQHGFDEIYDGPHYRAAIAYWRKMRPEFVDREWIEAGDVIA